MERQEERISSRLTSPNADIYQRLVRARRFIDDCYHLPLDLEQISKEACLSRFSLLEALQKSIQQAPHQYLTQRRI